MSDTEEQPVKKMKLSKEESAGLPPGAKPLSTQVAGHDTTGGAQSKKKGFYECEDGTILKSLPPHPDKRGTREVNFYQKVFDSDSKDPIIQELRPFLPKYVEVVTTPAEKNEPVKYLKLEDIAGKYRKPCVIDIKIGKITYDPEASEAKRIKESTKYPPLEKIGFQLRGFRVYSASKGDYEFYSKKFMHELDENSILTDGLKVYFSPDGKLREDVVKTCLEKLALIEKWFQKQKQFAFFASSILIAYEGLPDEAKDEQNTQNGSKSGDTGDQTAATEVNNEHKNKTNKTPADVRMIDFAHVFPGTAIDENYSYGLTSLINYLRKLTNDEK